MVEVQVVLELLVAVHVPHTAPTRLIILVADALVHHVVPPVRLIAVILPTTLGDVRDRLVAQTVVPTVEQVATKHVQETVQTTVEMDVLLIVVKGVQQHVRQGVAANAIGLVVVHVINNAPLDV